MPIIARTNIKEHRDSFSCEKFNFRLHHNITFYVYVSNFSWPIKIQVRGSGEGRIMTAQWMFTIILTSFHFFGAKLSTDRWMGRIRPTVWAVRAANNDCFCYWLTALCRTSEKCPSKVPSAQGDVFRLVFFFCPRSKVFHLLSHKTEKTADQQID